MKTIYTSLPIYNKIQKQCFERGKSAGNDKPVPIVCPRHRLPSFQWLDNGDGCASVSKVELFNKDGICYTPSPLQSWYNGILDPYDTAFISSGLDILSAIDVAGGGCAAYTSQLFHVEVGDIIKITGTYSFTGGSNRFWFIVGGGFDGAPSGILANGLVDITHTFTTAGDFQLMISGVAGVTNYSFTNVEIKITTISSYFQTIPSPHAITGDVYFDYKGDILNYLLPVGEYYLKITMDNGYVYYSDWFRVDCVFKNLITAWYKGLYETFTSTGSIITSAIETGISGTGYSNVFSVTKGESITVILYLTKNSGQNPSINIYSSGVGGGISNISSLLPGLNVITLTITDNADDAVLNIFNTGPANYITSEVLAIRHYSEKYLMIDFYNECDLGDILYHDGFEQTVWFESEPMECTFPLEEEIIKDGYGFQIRSFSRQDKKYIAKTMLMPDYMAEVFNRMKLHDNIQLTDLLGDVNDVYNLEVEQEWVGDDKYYTKIDLMFDFNEAWVVAGCCNNLT